MKKIILTFAALLAFGIARAQDPQQPVPKKEMGKKQAVSTKTDVAQQNEKDVKPQPDAFTDKKPDGTDNSQTRKDEMVPDDHLKGTAAPAPIKGTGTTKKVRNASKKRQ